MIWYLSLEGEKRIKKGHRHLRASDIVNNSVITQSQSSQAYPLHSAKGSRLGLVIPKKGHFVIANVLWGWHVFDAQTLCERVKHALKRRVSWGLDPQYCRVLFGSSDECSGLVLDRYENVWVAMVYEPAWREILVQNADLIMETFGISSWVIKSADPSLKTICMGETPCDTWVKEHGRSIWIDVLNGQKTGWYYDQRANRQALQKVTGRWADVCCYHGGFGIAALSFGAEHVTFVDRSEQALMGVKRSVPASLEAQADYVCQDAAAWLEASIERKVLYDGVMCDPPCFLKGKKMVVTVERAYRRWIALCIALIAPGGTLVFSSCSSSVTLRHLSQWVMKSLAEEGRSGRIIYQGRADRDHPYNSVEPEMDYLSCVFVKLDVEVSEYIRMDSDSAGA